MITNTNCEPVVNNKSRVELNLTLKHCVKHDNNTEEDAYLKDVRSYTEFYSIELPEDSL